MSDPPSGDYRSELLILAAPAILGQAIDPLAQLMETAYIGRLGAGKKINLMILRPITHSFILFFMINFCMLIIKGVVELASAGVSVSIFNIISKLFNVPLLSITTSFVAEDISKHSKRYSALG